MKIPAPTAALAGPDRVELVVPRLDLLPAYEAALERGWSSDTMRNVSGEQLAALRADPETFLHALMEQNGTVTLHDGRTVPRLPFHLFWLWDGDFCGSIMLRFQPGTEELPPYCLGHIGYSVVPWKQRRGYANAALRLILPVARSEGLRGVQISCREGNIASRKVIEANGGRLEATMPAEEMPGETRLVYRVPLL